MTMTNTKQICNNLRQDIKDKMAQLYELEHKCSHKYIKNFEDKTECEKCGHIEWDTWFCPSSPNGLCHYDYDVAAWDECIYCGEEKERP